MKHKHLRKRRATRRPVPAKKQRSEGGAEAAQTATLVRRAWEFGVSPNTLRKALVAQGAETDALTIQATHHALLGGDVKAARAKESMARADLLTQQAARERGELLPLADAESFLVRTLQPLREKLNAMPALLAARCNPTDPAHARAILQEWTDEVVAIGREGK